MAMYVLRLIRTPDKEYKSPRSLGVRVNESRLYLVLLSLDKYLILT